MPLLFDAAAKSFNSLFVPGMLRIFFYSLMVTLAVLGLFVTGTVELFSDFAWFSSPAGGWLNFGAGIIAIISAWFLFPLTLPVIVSFFDEKIADRVETHFYPNLALSHYPFWPTFWQDVRFSLKALGLNLLCAPLYLIPLVNIGIYYLLNGYLLGHQFFRMAAGRRISEAEAEPLMVRNRWLIIFGGMMISFAATIPFLNILSPFLGVAMMIHLFHGLWKERA